MKKLVIIMSILLGAPMYPQQENTKATSNNQNQDAAILAHFYLQRLQYTKRALDLIQSSQPFNTLYAQDKQAATAMLPLERSRTEPSVESLIALYNNFVDLYTATYALAQKQHENLKGLPASIAKL